MILTRLIFVLAVATAFGSPAFGVEVRGMRLWHAPDYSRVVLDLSEAATPRVFGLDSSGDLPSRLVIDLPGARFAGQLPSPQATGPLIHKVRKGRPNPGTLRLVLDLEREVQSDSFALGPNRVYGHRFVIDLRPSGQASPVEKKPTVEEESQIVVVIDPGHGGEDPGAVGARGTYEKNIALAIAKKVARQLTAHTEIRTVLTRRGDYFISLRKRREIARKHHADLFVSVHADAFKNAKARGSSVYALSQGGATSEQAKWLADQENASDLIGGESLSDKDPQLARVLFDMSITDTINESLVLGDRLLSEFKTIGPVHSRRVEQAGFLVLKSPDIPSVLVETGYITNPHEEKLLRSDAHQEKVAQAIYVGILAHLETIKVKRAALESQRNYTVRTGDSLSLIAKRTGSTVARLKQLNEMSSDTVYVGQTLRIR